MKNSKQLVTRSLSPLILLAMVGVGCSSEHKRTATGAGVGAVGGGAVGAVVGGTKGAVIGAGIGAVAGGVIGNRLDKQAKELGEVAETRRTEEGILVNLKNDLLFPTGSSTLSESAKTQLKQLADVLVKYPTNRIMISGHTDSMGSSIDNEALSRYRARAVESILIQNGVKPDQIQTQGYGESQPVTTNATAKGRAKNRRVELFITDIEAEREGEK